MDKPTYRIDRITDLLQVPADRREQCLLELRLLLDLTEFGGVTPVMAKGFIWADDGDFSARIEGQDGEPFLMVQVTEAK